MTKKTIVLSLGGSLIVPKDIDVVFLKSFRDFILKHKDKKFIIVCGGGSTNKVYNTAARQLSKISDNDLDWIGIKTTILNAELVKSMFADIAYERVVNEPVRKIKTNKRVIVCSGWKPGWSSDYDAVILAKNFGAQVVVNLTNTDYVYDKDPKKYSDAQPIKEISWHAYRKVISNKWSPRLNSPFDPIASRLAEKLRLKVAVLNGRNLVNLEAYLSGHEFRGTVIT